MVESSLPVKQHGGDKVPRITLTDLVDIVSTSGTSKATKVASVKRRPPYDPRFDFYKPFREHLIALHTSGGPKEQVGRVLDGLTDSKKKAAYPELVKGYITWWGRKRMQWFNPPIGIHTGSDVEIRVNPEIGLLVNDVPYVIKLYLKSGRLTKTHSDIVLHLMEKSLRSACTGDAVMAILDVRNSKLATLGTVDPTVLAMVQAELAYVAAIWPEI